MSNSIYLIQPKPDFPNYYSAEVCAEVGLTPVAFIADLTLVTVAALVPDDFEVTVCDEFITPIDFDSTADFIGLTGKSSQVGRLIEVAQEFRRRGKVVIIGGPYATLVPDVMRPHCDILVRGEIESLAPRLFADLRAGDWLYEYIGGQPDLNRSPLPRWDLYPNDRALLGCIQTARGCPFECEFCDVIQYAGRKQRHKPIEQVLAELDIVYSQGYSHVFIADDNFTVYRRRAKEVLKALRDWNNRQPDGRLTFTTQLSIDTAREEEILQLCAEAGIDYVFIGLETPNEESLRESKKRQNLGANLFDQIERFLDYGIAVMGGMIVGFDSDGYDIFERQYDFAMATPVPIFTLGSLVAPEATPLYDRLQEDNRLISGNNRNSYAANPWQTNIIPKQMTQEELFTGLRWLSNRLYQPAAFGKRVLQFIEHYRAPVRPSHRPLRPPSRPIDTDLLEVLHHTYRLGAEEAQMFSEVTAAVLAKPVTKYMVMHMMFQYNVVRYMYHRGQFWEPHLAEYTKPQLAPLLDQPFIQLHPG